MLITLIFKLAASSAVLETIDALTVEFWLHYIPNDRHGELGPFCKILVSGCQRFSEFDGTTYRFLKGGLVLCEVPVELATIRDAQSCLSGSMGNAFVS
jgi:hypothetical protein